MTSIAFTTGDVEVPSDVDSRVQGGTSDYREDYLHDSAFSMNVRELG